MDYLKAVVAVQNLLLIFHESYSINYLRYVSLYLETMGKLRCDHPDIHEKEIQIRTFCSARTSETTSI